MENKLTFKLIVLSVCILLMLASGFVLVNQVRLNKEIIELQNGEKNTLPSIAWADSDNTENYDNEVFNDNINENNNSKNNENEAVQTQAYNNYTNADSDNIGEDYVININSKKIHSFDCQAVSNMLSKNKKVISKAELNEYIYNGYSVCSICNAGQ